MLGEEEEARRPQPSPSGMANRSTSKTPFWNVNTPQQIHTTDCPGFLRYALTNDKDRDILSTPDSEYRRQTWREVRQFIHENRLDLFQRLPSDLRRYREYCAKLVEDYGSVMEFVMKERLRWVELAPKGAAFCEPSDIKILYNDWPYGLDERIVHLVVWTKFELASEPITSDSPLGDLTHKARKEIEFFVDQTFVSVCGRENVVWFKNWGALKSIHAVEHFHVMLFDPDRTFVSHITGRDVPLADKVRRPDRA